jgi:hypothetical protein
LAVKAKSLFLGRIMLVVIFVVFSKERTTGVFIVASRTIGGIIALDVKTGGLVC